MTSGRWEKFCIVGFGGHARTKLLPALAANGQELVAVVSRQPRESLPPEAACFGDLASAIAALPRGVCFVIASPPAQHFEQVSRALEAGRDTIVEKPAFVSAEQARSATQLAIHRGAVLVEAFMHRHTQLYRQLLADWRPDAERLDIDFLIPAMPEGTFRELPDVSASALYDIGSYVLALLLDLDLPLDRVTIDRVDAAGTPSEQIQLVADAPVPVCARIGVAAQYANTVAVERSGQLTIYRPFFYGRAGDRFVESDRAVKSFAEPDAFQALLGQTRGIWLSDQRSRLAGIVAVTERLEILGRQLKRIREAL